MEYLQSADKSIFLSFIKGSQEIPVFLRPAWLDLVSNKNKWAVVFFHDNENLLSFFIYPIGRKLMFDFSIMPDLTYFTGLWFHSSIDKNNQSYFIRKIINVLPSFYYQKIVLNHCDYDLAEFENAGYKLSKKITYIISRDNKNFQKKYDPKLRSDIGFAKKQLEVINQNDCNDLYNSIEHTFKRQKLKPPFNKALIEKIVLAKDITHKIYTAVDTRGLTHASMMVIEDELTVYNILSGRNADAIRGSVALLINTAIEEAILKNKNFDFEGSSLPGVKTFYESFGGELKNPVVISKSKHPWVEILVKWYKS
jgi:hypothetical protein